MFINDMTYAETELLKKLITDNYGKLNIEDKLREELEDFKSGEVNYAQSDDFSAYFGKIIK